MNYKLEKFWNYDCISLQFPSYLWTINLKSFEIEYEINSDETFKMNYKLEKFWNAYNLKIPIPNTNYEL